jgi:hypothetical protein
VDAGAGVFGFLDRLEDDLVVFTNKKKIPIIICHTLSLSQKKKKKKKEKRNRNKKSIFYATSNGKKKMGQV